MIFNTNLYEERQRWTQNVCESAPQLNFTQLYNIQQDNRRAYDAAVRARDAARWRVANPKPPSIPTVAEWDAMQAKRVAKEARQIAGHNAARRKAARWAAGKTALRRAGVVGAAYTAGELGYMAGNAIGNTDIVQGAAGGVGEWIANNFPAGWGGTKVHTPMYVKVESYKNRNHSCLREQFYGF